MWCSDADEPSNSIFQFWREVIVGDELLTFFSLEVIDEFDEERDGDEKNQNQTWKGFLVKISLKFISQLTHELTQMDDTFRRQTQMPVILRSANFTWSHLVVLRVERRIKTAVIYERKLLEVTWTDKGWELTISLVSRDKGGEKKE